MEEMSLKVFMIILIKVITLKRVIFRAVYHIRYEINNMCPPVDAMYHICTLTERLQRCSLLTVVHVNLTHEFFFDLRTQNSFPEQSGDINST